MKRTENLFMVKYLHLNPQDSLEEFIPTSERMKDKRWHFAGKEGDLLFVQVIDGFSTMEMYCLEEILSITEKGYWDIEIVKNAQFMFN